MRVNSERLVALRWDDQVEGEYHAAELRIEVENRRGMIAVLATRINSHGRQHRENIHRGQGLPVHLRRPGNAGGEPRYTWRSIMKRLRSFTTSVRKVARIKNFLRNNRSSNVTNRAIISTPAAPEPPLAPIPRLSRSATRSGFPDRSRLLLHTMELVTGDISAQATQVFENLAAVAGSRRWQSAHDAVKDQHLPHRPWPTSQR